MTAAHAVPPDERHTVSPVDERRHTPDPEDLWNESYYCDFVQADGSLGGWIRLGLYPNRQAAWWTAWIVWPDRPGVCSVDYFAPVPPGDSLVSESAQLCGTGGRVEFELRHPLEEFHLAAAVPARTIADAADVYEHGEAAAGTPTELDLDLTWVTDGFPYHYDVTTRYEIPCTVSGTIAVGGETYAIEGQGQRDHSWAVRDWWAFGWCWYSVRLEDGTRVHLADIRMGLEGMPVFFGYVQTPGAVHPLTACSVTEELGDHDFPVRARIEVEAGSAHKIAMNVSPVAFGPVLLRDDRRDRVSRFPRAMVTCRADDGRTGAGWIEWNQPNPGPGTVPPA